MPRQQTFNSAIKPILKSHQQTTTLLNKLGKQGWAMGNTTNTTTGRTMGRYKTGTTGRNKGGRQAQTT